MGERRFAALGLWMVGLGLPAGFAIEAATRPAGTDGDNAAESLAYLQEHATAYRLSGVCLLIAALGAIRAATAVPWRTPFLTAVGSVAGGLWVFTGAIRLSAPGPIDHINGYDRDWGEAAYITVQMAGTQAGLLGGVILIEFWIISSCLISWRATILPRALCVLGLLALVYPVAASLSVLGGEVGSGLWIAGIGSVFLGLPVWCVATGIWTFLTARHSGSAPGPVVD